jgi:Subtilase family
MKPLAYSAKDAYLSWATQTNFRDFGALAHLTDDDFVAVAIECKTTVQAFVKSVKSLDWIRIPRAYLQPQGKHASYARTRFCTARLRKQALNKLGAYVKRFELSLGHCADLHEQLSASPAPAINDEMVVVVIDDFVGFAHADFWSPTSSQSRIRYVWHQDSGAPNCMAATTQWQANASMSYGFELRTNQPLLNHRSALEQQYPTRLRHHTHGSHVASLAAGCINHNTDLPTVSQLSPRKNMTDAASQAGIIAVHLPHQVVQDGSGNSLSVPVIDALYYALQRVKPNTRIVVNMSYCTYAGAHDGSSLLEAAMDEWIKLDADQHAIVLPSGNHFDARCHAAFDLIQPTDAQILKWQVLPDSASSAFLEIWADVPSGSSLSVTVQSPLGESCAAIRMNTPDWFSTGKVWGVMYRTVIANPSIAHRKHQILIALAPTAQAAVSAPHGVWSVKVGYVGSKPPMSKVHAWIERSIGMKDYKPKGRQSFFVDTQYQKTGVRPSSINGAPASLSYIKREHSFNAFGGSPSVVIAAGYEAKSGWIAHYSGGTDNAASLGRPPNAAAVCDASHTLPGIRGASSYGVGSFRMNGTSVSAPLVTRWIANWLASKRGNLYADLANAAANSKQQGLFEQRHPAHPMEVGRVGAGRLDP